MKMSEKEKSGTTIITEPEAAEFEVVDIFPEYHEVEKGDTFDVEATILNDGDGEGDVEIVFALGDDDVTIVNRDKVKTFEAGEEKTVVFEDVETYDFEPDEYTHRVRVISLEEPPSSPPDDGAATLKFDEESVDSDDEFVYFDLTVPVDEDDSEVDFATKFSHDFEDGEIYMSDNNGRAVLPMLRIENGDSIIWASDEDAINEGELVIGVEMEISESQIGETVEFEEYACNVNGESQEIETNSVVIND